MIIVKIADVEALPILNSLPELSSKWAGYVLNHPLNGPSLDGPLPTTY